MLGKTLASKNSTLWTWGPQVTKHVAWPHHSVRFENSLLGTSSSFSEKGDVMWRVFTEPHMFAQDLLQVILLEILWVHAAHMGPTQTWHLGNVRKPQDSILAPWKGKHLDGTVHNQSWSWLSHLPFSLLHSNVVYAWVMSPHQVSLRSLKPSHCPSHWILF